MVTACAQRLNNWSHGTDVQVLAIHYASRLSDEIWISAGTFTEPRFISVHTVANKLGQLYCQCLPALNALSGCDTTGVFFVDMEKPLHGRYTREQVFPIWEYFQWARKLKIH